jgi:hypothetical protein
MLEVADILREVGPAYRARFGDRMLPSHLRAMSDIVLCRTPALGGHLAKCDRCGEAEYSYHSCRNRHCPKCHGDQTERWLEAWRPRLLPCPYFLLTFTVPKELRALARANQKVVYGTLMHEAACALQKLAADPRYLGARPGMLAVLHTWTRDMLYHPHVHMLVTGGGLDHRDGSWIPSRNPAFLLPCRALSVIFSAKVRDALQKKELIAGIPARTWRRRWVVHCQHAGTGEKVLEYLGRYVHRIAIANSRIESFDGEHVVFRYRENRSGQMKRCRIDATEFVRRFMQHVLPRRFVKVRSYGLFSSSCRDALDLARQHLTPATGAPSSQSFGSGAPRDEHKEITERTCSHCNVGRMRIVAELLPSFTAGAPLNIRAPP